MKKKQWVTFAPGTYKVKLSSNSKYVTYRKIGYRFPSNSTIRFRKGVVFKLEPSKEIYYHILDFSGTKNVNIEGQVSIIGDAKEKDLNKGEWGHGIAFNGAKHIKVDSVFVSYCWGDGVRFGSLDDERNPKNPICEAPEDIIIKYAETSNNRRLGVGITNAKNVHFIKLVANSNNGTPPRAGIDIEPNFAYEFTEAIVIDTLITRNNHGGGLWVIPMNCRKNPVDIRIDKCFSIEDGINDYSSEGALRITSIARTNKLKGRIRINDLKMVRPRKRGIYINNWSDKDCEFSVGRFTSQDSQLDDFLLIIDKKDIRKCSNIKFENVVITNSHKRYSWMRIIGNKRADVTINIGKIKLDKNKIRDIDFSKMNNKPNILVNNKKIMF